MKSNTELKHLCLEYMAPWLPNLTRFLKFPAKDAQRIKMNSILEELINITVTERGVINAMISYCRDKGRAMKKETGCDLYLGVAMKRCLFTGVTGRDMTWRDMTVKSVETT